MARKTVLFDQHNLRKAKMVPFGDWTMPVSYQSVLHEHSIVRTNCGLFDVSHMGEIIIDGSEAGKYLQFLTMNNVDKLEIGQGQYSGILNENGCFIDDLILYRLGTHKYLACVNASNTDKDFEWFKKIASDFKVDVQNCSDQFAQLAIQGPKSLEAIQSILSEEDCTKVSTLDYTGIAEVNIFNQLAYIARTGYTGEKGYELYLPVEIASQTWEKVLDSEPKTGIQPIGLGARDTLRLEACYLLYGNDINDTVTPLEAGVQWAVKFDCGDFIGKDALTRQKETGLTRKLFTFRMESQGIPRADMAIYIDDQQVGVVTSGSVLPSVGGAGGMALLNSDINPDSKIEVDIRGKRRIANIVKRPLYSAKVRN